MDTIMDTQTLAILILVANFAIGVVFCFFGNRWLKIIVALYGFVVGFLLAASLIPMFTMLGDSAVLLISIFVGLVGALLFVLFIYLGVFFIGFGGGIILCILLIRAFDLNIFDWYVYVPMMITCSALGSLTLNKRRIFISIFTSFIGASALAQCVFQVTSDLQPQMPLLYFGHQSSYGVYTSTIYLISLAALFFVGLIIQLKVTSKKM